MRTPNKASAKHHYFLIEVNHTAKTVNVRGFRQPELEKATDSDPGRRKENKEFRKSRFGLRLLVSVDLMEALRQGLPKLLFGYTDVRWHYERGSLKEGAALGAPNVSLVGAPGGPHGSQERSAASGFIIFTLCVCRAAQS